MLVRSQLHNPNSLLQQESPVPVGYENLLGHGVKIKIPALDRK
jgi:hypothetical protein